MVSTKRLLITGIFLVSTLALAGTALADDPPNVTVEGAGGLVEIKGGKVKVRGEEGTVEVEGGRVKAKGAEGTVEVKGGTRVKATTKGASASVTTGANAKYVCSGNDKLAIKDEVFNLSSGAVVNASGNCEVHMKDCVINAPIAFIVDGNARVVFSDGSINAGEVAVRAGGNSNVSIRDSSVNGTRGFELQGNAGAEFSDGTLNATKEYVLAQGKAKLIVRDSVVTGKKAVSGKATVRIED